VWVKSDLGFSGRLPSPIEAFYTAFEDLMPPEAAEEWRIRREEEREAREAEEEAEARREREKEAQAAEELALQYVFWRSAWEADIEQKKTLTTFPHLAVSLCICNNVECRGRKAEEGGLGACQHDVERILRASGNYSMEWLRKERLQWHPDRFGRRCHPDFKEALQKKATELYSIFETLIEKERGDAA